MSTPTWTATVELARRYLDSANREVAEMAAGILLAHENTADGPTRAKVLACRAKLVAMHDDAGSDLGAGKSWVQQRCRDMIATLSDHVVVGSFSFAIGDKATKESP